MDFRGVAWRYTWQSDPESANSGGTVPTYAYVCTSCEHRFDIVQSFSDDSLTECPECEGRLRKLFNAVGVVFKGSGFYSNDSRSDSRNSSGKSSGNGSRDGKSASGDKGSATSATPSGDSGSSSSDSSSTSSTSSTSSSTSGSSST